MLASKHARCDVARGDARLGGSRLEGEAVGSWVKRRTSQAACHASRPVLLTLAGKGKSSVDGGLSGPAQGLPA
ncbi:hypothetical protein CHLRE_12g548391v5 [Chlamydomonas reinhardtii]|uniref:Uncharacterized protein n=1 Tax=Chlamydomonas reinhardtii TaxID=3055 RepID=A0A2K3D6C6_CHLRE|nr:uncharacterized protein CHLRE_12g548391v5 [Chlamydomonas reinhardtii]PNW76086.1 hypothetical protein CHLRE_12g548391v5 [Chlamydomonas reinhardtii]